MKRSTALVVGKLALPRCGGRNARNGAGSRRQALLTFTGEVTNHNDGTAVVLDLRTLKAVVTATQVDVRVAGLADGVCCSPPRPGAERIPVGTAGPIRPASRPTRPSAGTTARRAVASPSWRWPEPWR